MLTARRAPVQVTLYGLHLVACNGNDNGTGSHSMRHHLKHHAVAVNRDDDIDNTDFDGEVLETTSRVSESSSNNSNNIIRDDTATMFCRAFETFPKQVRAVSLINGGTAIQVQRSALYDNESSRCSIRTTRALPKPSHYTRVTHKLAPPIGCGMWNRRRHRSLAPGNNENDTMHTTSENTAGKVTWQPFREPFRGHDNQLYTAPRLVSYFEVHIVEQDPLASDALSTSSSYIFEDNWTVISELPHSQRDEWMSVVVGVSTTQFDCHTAFPGDQDYSVGYHGTDGRVWCFGQDATEHHHHHNNKTNHADSSSQSYGPSFGVDDVIGCGIDYPRSTVFWTRNGHFLGHAPFTMSSALLGRSKWHPTVGFGSPRTHQQQHSQQSKQHPCVQVNTQGPFQFDLESMLFPRERTAL